MGVQDIEIFSKLLQMSMLPMVLISAASLLLLSITNRLGRAVDRSRGLALELDTPTDPHGPIRAQLNVLLRRSEFLRSSVSCIALSLLFSTTMIVGLYFLLFLGFAAQRFILAFFLLSILALMASVVFFMLDIYAALKALRLHIEQRDF